MYTPRVSNRPNGFVPLGGRPGHRAWIGGGATSPWLPTLALACLAGGSALAQPKGQDAATAQRPGSGTAPAVAAGAPNGVVVSSTTPGDEDGDDDEVGEHDGTIVRIDGDLLYFDVGTDRGVRVGQTVRVLRTIIAKHPVTGRRLVDHFPLGTLVVEGAGSILSVGKAQRRIAPLVKIGDVVNVSQPASSPAPSSPAGRVVASAPSAVTSTGPGEKGRPTGPAGSAAEQPGAARPPAVAPTAPEPSPTSQVMKAYEAALGRALPERIRVFESFLSTHRDSPYRAAVEQELFHLRTLLRTLEQTADQLARAREQRARAAASASAPVPAPRDVPVANVLLPSQIDVGQPLEVTIYVGNPGTVRSAVLYIRRDGEPTYQLLPFKEDATGYYRVQVPERLTAAGAVELFVGLRNPEEQLFLLAGSADQPTPVRIEPPVGPPPSPGPNHSAVSGFFEFVDFNRFRGNDYYFNAEADFMYRIGGILYSVRTGFGTLSGYGESVNSLDVLNLAPRPVGINYGYLEGELRFHRLVGLAVRGLAGQSKAGPGGGAELKLRIGSEMGTNLIIGGAIVSDFGALAQLKLEWNVIRNWPMSVTVVATNQPVQTDLGVRLIYQVGWRFRHWFAPTLRVGYDVRNINHGGLSLGLGVVMGW